MEYYAKNKNEKGHQETVEHHLRRTSELCYSFGKNFNEEKLCEIIGLLHDSGKYTKTFQEVLKGKEKHVNHALVGAKLISNKNKDLGSIIAGHHTSLDLKTTMSDINAFQKKEEKDINGLKIASPDKEEIELILNTVKKYELINDLKSPIDLSKYSKNEQMFLLRMVYSCLVDADFSASAECDNPEYLKESTGQELNYDYLLERLEVYKNNITKNSNSENKINKLREKVYLDCSNSAKQLSGLFTLTAPTGTGKTLAMLKFALEHGKINNKKQIFFILPFLSIIEQNVQIYKEICGEDYVLEDTSQNEYSDTEREFSDRWSSPITVLTSVKFFEALFQNKNTKCRKLHNLANSIIIFDEAQSLPPNVMATTLEVMNFLVKKFNCTVVFSTATQPSFDIRKDIDWKPIEIIDNPQQLYNDYALAKLINVEWNINNKISFDEIANNIKDKNNACVIVNRKDHAEELYSILTEYINEEYVFYISTNLAPIHRQQILSNIKEKLKNKEKCILISTQCIEAGVDLSFDIIYRALAPLEAIIQASGRCNRNGENEGKLIVFIPENKKKYPSKSYENSALQVEILNKEKEIDINNLENIYNYYYKIFNSSVASHDSPELITGIDDKDFNKVAKEYKIINNQGYNIIVPFSKRFQDIKTLIYNNDYIINKGLMKKAVPISISCYNKEFCDEYCVKLYLKKKNGDLIDSGWYLLDNDEFYDLKLGLITNKDVDFIF